MKPIQPPMLATWLLTHFGCSPNNEAVLGDLMERYRLTPKMMWYWQQVVLAILASFLKEIWGHKLQAIRALFVGWLIKTVWLSLVWYEFWTPHVWILKTYISPASSSEMVRGVSVFLSLTVIGCIASAGLVRRVSYANERPMVLLYLAVELTGPILLIFGMPFSRSLMWASRSLDSFWPTAFAGVINFGPLNFLGYRSGLPGIFIASAITAIMIILGGGLLRAQPRRLARW